MYQGKRFKVFVIKHALTSGILEVTVEDCFDISPKMVKTLGQHYLCYHKPFWHETLEEARAHVGKMLAARRASLTKQLALFAPGGEAERRALEVWVPIDEDA